MGYVLTVLAMLAVIAAFGLAFINASPRKIADTVRTIGPLVLAGTGGILAFAGRGGIGIPLLAVGFTWWARNRRIKRMTHSGGSPKSTVRSAWLEMELDHETGDLDGFVLTGNNEGSRLSELSDEVIMDLYQELADDGESCALMEAYLDRRTPGWSDHTERSSGTGQGSTAGSGPMTKEEAYQVLGLQPGAGADEIREAHRRLMKRVHPDSGGSTFLAARINEAKDTLL